MGFMNNIHNAEGYKVISGFGNTFVCDNAIDANKTIIFPDGWNNDTNLSFKVIFKYGHNCADDQTYMTLNSIPIVVNQYGTLIPLPIHEMDDSGTTKYKSLQPNTILEMYYTNDYDGNNTHAFIVIGNPIVLSSADYTIYANGQIRYIDENKLSDYEDVTYPFTAQYDGFVTVIVNTGANQFGHVYINDNAVGTCGGISNAREYGCGNSVTIPLNKGDVVTVGGNANSIIGKVRYFKNRDYSNR